MISSKYRRKYKSYEPWMIDEFYKLFKATAGEMNVRDVEIGNRVHEIKSYHADKFSPFYTAWSSEQMVGYAIAKRDERGQKKSSAHVAQLRVSVHPEFQGNQIGTDLVKLVVQRAHAQDVIKRIEVLNYETSINDRHWFEKLGFEVEGRLKKRIFANGKFIDAFSMAYIIE